MVEISTNEDKLTLACLAFLPESNFSTEIASKQHVNALEDVLYVNAFDSKDALVAEQVLAVISHQRADVALKFANVEFTLKFHACRCNSGLVFMFCFRGQEFWIHFEHLLQVECSNVHELLWVNDAVFRVEDWGESIDGLYSGLDIGNLFIIDQIDFVEHNSICKSKLLDRFVFNSLGLLIVEVLDDVLCIDNCDDSIQIVLARHSFRSKEGLGYRSWVSEPRSLDNDSIQILYSVVHVVKNFRQVTTNSTANASVHDFNDAFFGTLDKDVFVDTNIAKFVFDNGELHFVLGACKDVVQEGGFS